MKSARYLFAETHMLLTTMDGIKRSGKTAWFFQPVIASILEKQKTLRIMSAIAGFQIVFTTFGVWGWQCPVYSTIDIPCPGCGLSTALVSLIGGDWQTAVTTHVFAPLLFVALLAMAILSMLPGPFYRVAVQRLAVLEAKTGWTVLFLIGFIGYWGLRIFWLF